MKRAVWPLHCFVHLLFFLTVVRAENILSIKKNKLSSTDPLQIVECITSPFFSGFSAHNSDSMVVGTNPAKDALQILDRESETFVVIAVNRRGEYRLWKSTPRSTVWCLSLDEHGLVEWDDSDIIIDSFKPYPLCDKVVIVMPKHDQTAMPNSGLWAVATGFLEDPLALEDWLGERSNSDDYSVVTMDVIKLVQKDTIPQDSLCGLEVSQMDSFPIHMTLKQRVIEPRIFLNCPLTGHQ